MYFFNILSIWIFYESESFYIIISFIRDEYYNIMRITRSREGGGNVIISEIGKPHVVK